MCPSACSKIRHYVATFILFLYLFDTSHSIVEEDETNYVKIVLQDLDSSNNPHEQSNLKAKVSSTVESRQVKRFWGIPDASASVGRIFNYSIPPDAFSGQIHRFEIAEAGESTLPSWLQFDQASRTFLGVPLHKDIGQYYITVKAYGQDQQTQGKPSVAKDVFSIEVAEDSSEGRFSDSDSSIPRCKSGESQTMASIIIDFNLEEFNATRRAEVLKSTSSFLKLPLKLFKAVHKKDGPAFDGNALQAGPGDANKQKNSGGIIQWLVGCGMSVHTEHKDPIDFLEKASNDGSLAQALGYPIIGWQITNVFPKYKRDKRHIGGWGTPVPSIMPTHLPTATENVDEFDVTDETMTPESRIIPTMASPIFTQPSHKHRHHHGDIGRGRAGHYQPVESPTMTISPTMHHHHPVQNQVATPHWATPVEVPDRPTKYIPTTSFEEIMPSRYLPEEHTPIDSIMSSMTSPIYTFGKTEDLPTTTFTKPPEVVTSTIKPTKTKIEEETRKPSIPNFTPTIDKRMKKLIMKAGKVWRYQIPADTFSDMEDGDTRQLKLIFLTAERTSIPSSSWIQLDPEDQVLYALPLEEHIGKYEFILEAMDSEGASTNDHLEIHVWQHSSARARHHEFTINLKYNKYDYPVAIDWSTEFAKRLSSYFGDKNASHIAVQSIQYDPVIFTWWNDSLKAYPCPTDEINYLKSKLIDNKNKIVKSFKQAIGTEFKILDVSFNKLGACYSPDATTSTHSNFAPMLRNPIERINTTVGEILRFKIPDDTFYDFEDGSTRYLDLTFLTIESLAPPKSTWVQFSRDSQELYGLPFDTDVGRHEYQLVAMDSSGLQINDVFVIEVHPRPPKKWNVEFSLHIDTDYDDFSRNISQKVLVAWKLAKLYSDPDPRFITVGSISKGSVVYAWTNNTLPHDPCPKQTIKRLVENIFNVNGTLSSKLVHAMYPEFKIIKADAMPLGICLGEVTPTSVTVTPSPPPIVQAPPKVTSDDDIYITTIIPAVVIAVMLIIAAMVACFLYRKKRKGKMTMQDHNTFIGNRAPVIFGDEMEDKPDPAKPPVIMKEEKPPLAPPDYLRSSASSRDSTPQLDRIEQPNSRNTNADLHVDPSPPYQPPPPFTTNRDSKNSRPKTTPTYRQPPPYMPPVPP